jgi:hypothetical protein
MLAIGDSCCWAVTGHLIGHHDGGGGRAVSAAEKAREKRLESGFQSVRKNNLTAFCWKQTRIETGPAARSGVGRRESRGESGAVPWPMRTSGSLGGENVGFSWGGISSGNSPWTPSSWLFFPGFTPLAGSEGGGRKRRPAGSAVAARPVGCMKPTPQRQCLLCRRVNTPGHRNRKRPKLLPTTRLAKGCRGR